MASVKHDSKSKPTTAGRDRAMERGIGRTKSQDGSTLLRCFVEPTRVRSLYAWALTTWADNGRVSPV